MKKTKKILSLMLSVVLLLALAPFAVSANAAKPADYANAIYFEGFEGDTALDADTTLKYGGSTATVMSGDSALTTETETGSYLELKSGAVGTNMTFGVEYETATSPVESKYPAAKVAQLARTQVSFDICPVDIDKQVNVYMRDKLTTDSTKSYGFMNFSPDGTCGFTAVGSYSYTEAEWISVDFYFDFDKKIYSLYIDDVAIFENAPNETNIDKCVEALVFHADNIAEGEKYTFYVDNMRIAIPEMYAADIVNYDFEDVTAENAASKGIAIEKGTIAISDSGTDRGKVALFTSTSAAAAMVLQPSATQSFASYQKYGKYPDVVEFDFELIRETNNELWINIDGKNLLLWGTDGNFKVGNTKYWYSGYNNRPWVGAGATKPYTNIKLTINFAESKYSVYIDENADVDNQYQGYIMNGGSLWFDLNSDVKNPERLAIFAPTSNTKIRIAKVRVSAAAPYGENAITDYLTEDGYKNGFVLNNADAEKTLKYNVYCAKYDSQNVLETVTITPGTVAPGTMELKNIEILEATDGGYYRYFIWEDGTLVPLVLSK